MKSVRKRMKLEYIMVNEVIQTLKGKHPMLTLIYESRVYKAWMFICEYLTLSNRRNQESKMLLLLLCVWGGEKEF